MSLEVGIAAIALAALQLGLIAGYFAGLRTVNMFFRRLASPPGLINKRAPQGVDRETLTGVEESIGIRH